MARVDQDPEERDTELLRLSQLEECPGCRTLQEVEFVAQEGVYDVQELVEAPTTTAQCENCHTEWDVTYSGWTITEEA